MQPRIEVKLNPEKIIDAMVCEILEPIPKGDRSEYIKNAIIAYAKGDVGVYMESFVRKIIREELQNSFGIVDATPVAVTVPVSKPADVKEEPVQQLGSADVFADEELDDGMFADFLDGLESLS